MENAKASDIYKIRMPTQLTAVIKYTRLTKLSLQRFLGYQNSESGSWKGNLGFKLAMVELDKLQLGGVADPRSAEATG